jgi:hypothetical protein
MAVENFVDADCTLGRSTFGVWSSSAVFEPSCSKQSAPTRYPLKRRPVAWPVAASAIPPRCVPQSSELFQEKSTDVPPIWVPKRTNFGKPSTAATFETLVDGSTRASMDDRATLTRRRFLVRTLLIENGPFRFVRSRPLSCLSGSNFAAPQIVDQAAVDNHVSPPNQRRFPAASASSR